MKEAGAEDLSFELLNRNVDQPYKYVGIWLVDEWSKIGLKVTQRVVPTGPWFDACAAAISTSRSRRRATASSTRCSMCRITCRSSVSGENYGDYEDPKAVELYNKMLHETDPQKQHALMLAFEKHNLDEEAHAG